MFYLRHEGFSTGHKYLLTRTTYFRVSTTLVPLELGVDCSVVEVTVVAVAGVEVVSSLPEELPVSFITPKVTPPPTTNPATTRATLTSRELDMVRTRPTALD